MANVVDYFEIGTSDPAASTAFFSGLFGWEIGPPSGPAKYAMVEGDRGGLWDTSDTGGANWAIFYVQVDDVQASVDRAVALGATTGSASGIPSRSSRTGPLADRIRHGLMG